MKLIPLTEAAKTLNLGMTKMREIIALDNTFPAYKIGSRWKVDEEKLTTWVEAHSNMALIEEVLASKPKPKRESKHQSQKVWEVITPGWDQKSQLGKR